MTGSSSSKCLKMRSAEVGHACGLDLAKNIYVYKIINDDDDDEEDGHSMSA